jgi:hypothetical protein
MPTLFRPIRIFFAFTSAAALSVYVYLGTLIRPIGDDYCISARLIGYDPLTASLIKYWYTSNRFSNELLAWFSDLLGSRGVAVLAVTMLLLWLIGLTWFFFEAARLLRLRWNIWMGFLLSELIALVSYYSASNLFQSVYWRPGLMTYFTPLVIYAFIFTGILHGMRVAAGRVAAERRTPALASGASVETNGRTSLWTITLLFFAAFFAGGLSETAGALHISILGLALVATFIWNKGQTRRAALVLITSALAGALLAMFGMLITPANAIRLSGTETPTLTVVILRAFQFAAQFLSEAARLLRNPSAFAFVSGAILSYLFAKETGFTLPRHTWLGLALVPILTYLLIVAAFAPSAYGQSYPLERVRFPAHVLLVIALLLEGALLGLLAARWTLPHWATALAVSALLVTALYPLWMTRNNLALIPEYQTRAVKWDFRDARIRELAAAGEKNIVVWQLPGIAQVKDLDTRPSHWVNFCAAIYYDVDSISAPQGQIPSP